MSASNFSSSLRFVTFFITSATDNQQEPKLELHAVLWWAVPISFFLAILYNFLFSIKWENKDLIAEKNCISDLCEQHVFYMHKQANQFYHM